MFDWFSDTVYSETRRAHRPRLRLPPCCHSGFSHGGTATDSSWYVREAISPAISGETCSTVLLLQLLGRSSLLSFVGTLVPSSSIFIGNEVVFFDVDFCYMVAGLVRFSHLAGSTIMTLLALTIF